MAIYQRFGSPLEVIGNCGEHKPDYLNYDGLLLKVRYTDDNKESFQFADFMKADNGIHEILSAAEKAPAISLTSADLKAALAEAE